MERKTKQRLLGVLVIIGLVLILLPFFQDSREPVQEAAATVKAPPFPDQPVQLSEEDADTTNNGQMAAQPVASASETPDQATQPVQTLPEPQTQSQPLAESQDAQQYYDPLQSEQPLSQAQPSSQDVAEPVADQPGKASVTENPTPASASAEPVVDVVPESVPAPKIDEEAAAAPAIVASNEAASKQADSKQVSKTETPVPVKHKKAAAKVVSKKPNASPKKAIHTINKNSAPKVMKMAAALKQGPLDDNGLFKLKNPVWVIQIGSFKNKTNALKLVNKLRAKGYPAFIQQIAANTRVYVGPETKQTSARKLADQLKNELQLTGVVISYKPLTL